MKELNPGDFFPKRVWEDLVVDFLELACFMTEEQQDYLIHQLSLLNLQAESIEVHPCFSVQGKLVVVCEEIPVQECWVYFSRKKKIQKWAEAGLPEEVA